MIKKMFYLYCDNCNKKFNGSSNDEDKLTKEATKMGWKYFDNIEDIENLNTDDLCPECYNKKLEG